MSGRGFSWHVYRLTSDQYDTDKGSLGMIDRTWQQDDSQYAFVNWLPPIGHRSSGPIVMADLEDLGTLTIDFEAFDEQDVRALAAPFLRADLLPVLQLLARLTEAEFANPCRLDHHGYCQEHGTYEPPCPIPEAAKLLAEHGMLSKVAVVSEPAEKPITRAEVRDMIAHPEEHDIHPEAQEA